MALHTQRRFASVNQPPKEASLDSLVAQMNQRVSQRKASPLLKDIKLKRNAICPDWPGYLMKCKDTVIINEKNQMSLNKDIIGNKDFACKVIEN